MKTAEDIIDFVRNQMPMSHVSQLRLPVPPWQNVAMVSHVLFDFFGTLVTYAPDGPDHDFSRSYRLLQDMGSGLGYDEYRTLWAEIGDRFDQEADHTGREFLMQDQSAEFLRQALAREPTADEADAMAGAYLADWDTCVRYVPGLKAMLADLSASYRLAVISNTNDTGLVSAHLDAMGVRSYFDAVFLSVTVGWRKPHPRIFTAALGELGVEPGDAVFVGDSYRADFQGAARAGIRPFLIDPGHVTTVPDAARLSSVLGLASALAAVHQPC